MKQPTTVKEAKSMVKERWLDHRVEKLAKENDELREAVDELREDLDEAEGRSKETLAALSKTRRPGRMKWLVLAGGAYVLGAKAGRARYDQIKGWTRSMTRTNGNGTSADAPTGTTTGTSTGPTTGATTGATTGTTGKATGKSSGV